MYFRNYGLPKTWLDQCLKSPVSEDPRKSNMVNTLKTLFKFEEHLFTIFINHWEVNCLTKSLC